MTSQGTSLIKPRFIVVSGLIGVGKSMFAKQLADHLGYRAVFEPVEDNPYLMDRSIHEEAA